MTPSLSETMKSRYDGRQYLGEIKDPSTLENRKRLLYELEQALNITEDRLQLETVRKRSQESRTRIANRDIYRLYKAVTDRLNIEPRIVYTGGDIMTMSELEELLRETDKEISDLEPSL